MLLSLRASKSLQNSTQEAGGDAGVQTLVSGWLAAPGAACPALPCPPLPSLTGTCGCPLLHRGELRSPVAHALTPRPCWSPVLASQAATKQDGEMGPRARRNSESPRHTAASAHGRVADANHCAFPKRYQDVISQRARRSY